MSPSCPRYLGRCALLGALVCAAPSFAQDAVRIRSSDTSTEVPRLVVTTSTAPGARATIRIEESRLRLDGSSVLRLGTSSASPQAGDVRYDPAQGTVLYWSGDAAVWRTVATTDDAFLQGGNAFGALATLGTTDAQDLAVQTNGVERLRVTSSGIGVGTATPTHGVEVVGTAQAISGAGSTYGVHGERDANTWAQLGSVAPSGALVGVMSHSEGAGDRGGLFAESVPTDPAATSFGGFLETRSSDSTTGQLGGVLGSVVTTNTTYTGFAAGVRGVAVVSGQSGDAYGGRFDIISNQADNFKHLYGVYTTVGHGAPGGGPGARHTGFYADLTQAPITDGPKFGASVRVGDGTSGGTTTGYHALIDSTGVKYGVNAIAGTSTSPGAAHGLRGIARGSSTKYGATLIAGQQGGPVGTGDAYGLDVFARGNPITYGGRFEALGTGSTWGIHATSTRVGVHAEGGETGLWAVGGTFAAIYAAPNPSDLTAALDVYEDGGVGNPRGVLIGTNFLGNGLMIDADEIQTMHNGQPSNLLVNNDGGSVYLFNNDLTSRLGVGTSTPDHAVRVEIEADSRSYPLGCDRANDGGLIRFSDNGAITGSINQVGGVVSYNPFTGCHFATSEETGLIPGMVVVATGRGRGLDPQAARGRTETVYEIETTSRAADKRVLGVFWGEHAEHAEHLGPLLQIAAVGNGFVLVTDTGGDVETGDFLTSSARRGYAQRQESEDLKTFTLGKAMEAVRWDEVPVDPKLGFRWKLIACTYKAG